MVPMSVGQIFEHYRLAMKHAELPDLPELQHPEMIGRMTKGSAMAYEYLNPVLVL